MVENKNGIVLCMIVKNEAAVIARCLEAVKPLVSAWVVVDTGSTDGTREIVREVMKDIPGELVDRPWKNFGHNRTEALELARGRGDYSLVLDADDVVELAPGLELPPLDLDSYKVGIRYGAISYDRVQLLRNDRSWRYEGVIHEHPASDTAKTQGKLAGVTYVIHRDGARAKDPHRFKHDAELLEGALVEEPQNTRYAFYLAQSYRDAELFEKALAAYEHRATMGGWIEETFHALLEVARMHERQGHLFQVVHAAYLKAYEARPQRAEPLHDLAKYCRLQSRFVLARLYAGVAAEMPRPDDSLFVSDSVYTWRAKDELAVSAYHSGEPALGRRVLEKLLSDGVVPPQDEPRLRDNLEWCLKALAKAG